MMNIKQALHVLFNGLPPPEIKEVEKEKIVYIPIGDNYKTFYLINEYVGHSYVGCREMWEQGDEVYTTCEAAFKAKKHANSQVKEVKMLVDGKNAHVVTLGKSRPIVKSKIK